jgi:hypothetical protein
MCGSCPVRAIAGAAPLQGVPAPHRHRLPFRRDVSERAGAAQWPAEGLRTRRRQRLSHSISFLPELRHHAWAPTIDGLVWLADNGFSINVASRYLSGEPEAVLRRGFARLFAELGIALDADDPVALMIFPEMDATVDVPEITEACWGILGKSPESVMCATSRMVVKHKGAAPPSVIACTLLPYDPLWDLGPSLAGASGPVSLNHPHCAKFCVLGGAACSRG